MSLPYIPPMPEYGNLFDGDLLDELGPPGSSFGGHLKPGIDHWTGYEGWRNHQWGPDGHHSVNGDGSNPHFTEHHRK